MSAPIVQFKRDLVPAAIARFSVDLLKFLFGPASCRSTYFLAGFLYRRSDQNLLSGRKLKWSYVGTLWAA